MDVPIGSMWTKNSLGFIPLWSVCGACGEENIVAHVGDRDTVVVLSRPCCTFDELRMYEDIRVLTSSGVVGWLSRSVFNNPRALRRET